MMQTIRQAFTILRQNPLLSTISILGTAFAITMIMAIVITWQTKYADLEPEVNRSRCLYFSAMHMQGKENKDRNNYSTPSAAFMKECIQPIPEVEACTAFTTADVALILNSGKFSVCSFLVEELSLKPIGEEICALSLFVLLWPENFLEQQRLLGSKYC